MRLTVASASDSRRRQLSMALVLIWAPLPVSHLARPAERLLRDHRAAGRVGRVVAGAPAAVIWVPNV
jgi:hypothetical protein